MFQRFFEFIAPKEAVAEPDFIEVLGHPLPIEFRRHGRARNYVLRLHADRRVVVTLPRNGTKKFAREFVRSRKTWLEKQWKVLEARPTPSKVLAQGLTVLFRGQPTPLQILDEGGWKVLQFGGAQINLREPISDLRPALEKLLLTLARQELPARVQELAAAHQATFTKVVVRNQRSRWGSCSHRKTISLNWRLLQVPPEVRDYVIIHELMHLRHMNHSKKFWAAVAAAFPPYLESEKWLKQNGRQVGL